MIEEPLTGLAQTDDRTLLMTAGSASLDGRFDLSCHGIEVFDPKRLTARNCAIGNS